MEELRGSFVEGLDNWLRQVKTSFPDLDLSHVTIDAQARTLVQPVHSESMDELFTNNAPIDNPYGDGETTVESQIKLVVDSAHHSDEDTPVQQ